MRKDRHEQALAGENAFAGAHQLAKDAALFAAAVSEHSVHVNRRALEHHGAGLGDGAFAGIEFDLDELHLLAANLEVDIVCDVALPPVSSGNHGWYAANVRHGAVLLFDHLDGGILSSPQVIKGTCSPATTANCGRRTHAEKSRRELLAGDGSRPAGDCCEAVKLVDYRLRITASLPCSRGRMRSCGAVW